MSCSHTYTSTNMVMYVCAASNHQIPVILLWLELLIMHTFPSYLRSYALNIGNEMDFHYKLQVAHKRIVMHRF